MVEISADNDDYPNLAVAAILEHGITYPDEDAGFDQPGNS